LRVKERARSSGGTGPSRSSRSFYITPERDGGQSRTPSDRLRRSFAGAAVRKPTETASTLKPSRPPPPKSARTHAGDEQPPTTNHRRYQIKFIIAASRASGCVPCQPLWASCRARRLPRAPSSRLPIAAADICVIHAFNDRGMSRKSTAGREMPALRPHWRQLRIAGISRRRAPAGTGKAQGRKRVKSGRKNQSAPCGQIEKLNAAGNPRRPREAHARLACACPASPTARSIDRHIFDERCTMLAGARPPRCVGVSPRGGTPLNQLQALVHEPWRKSTEIFRPMTHFGCAHACSG